MPITDTPLRYPGGKSQLTPVVVNLLIANGLVYGEYAEPFAGGAGIAVTLLLNDYVSRIYLNDIDPAIHAFWHSVLHRTEELCELILSTPVTIEEWHRQRRVFLEAVYEDELQKGFATLFLNRTNRSGILRGGVIGGLEQKSAYSLDCRFSRDDLVRKIQRIAGYRDQIELSQLDAIDFLRTVIPHSSPYTLVNLDPPYFGKGPELYTSFYKQGDHAKLAAEVANLPRYWMVTYDNVTEIRNLYSGFPLYTSQLNYFAQEKRVGIELMVLDPRLVEPDQIRVSRFQACVG